MIKLLPVSLDTGDRFPSRGGEGNVMNIEKTLAQPRGVGGGGAALSPSLSHIIHRRIRNVKNLSQINKSGVSDGKMSDDVAEFI